MAEYMVLDVNAELRCVALLDRLGGHHVAFAPEALPAPGEFLQGTYPAAGLNLMSAAATGQVYRVIFEAVDCDLQMTFDRLRPRHNGAASAPPPLAQPGSRFSAARSSDTWDGVVPPGRSSTR